MSLRVYACSEPITEPDILESIRALPTEDDLSYDDGEPMETARGEQRERSGRCKPSPSGRNTARMTLGGEFR